MSPNLVILLPEICSKKSNQRCMEILIFKDVLHSVIFNSSFKSKLLKFIPKLSNLDFHMLLYRYTDNLENKCFNWKYKFTQHT